MGSSSNDAVPRARAGTPAARLDATGLCCATLTPTISARVRGLAFGEVLEILTDDPEAEEGLRRREQRHALRPLHDADLRVQPERLSPRSRLPGHDRACRVCGAVIAIGP